MCADGGILKEETVVLHQEESAMYTLVYLKWITNTFPLHSTWSCAQR